MHADNDFETTASDEEERSADDRPRMGSAGCARPVLTTFRAMARSDRPVIVLDDDENQRLHATWSRSGKRLIVTVTTTRFEAPHAEVELRPEQVSELCGFLGSSPE
jgi:hypothetical protein